MRRSILCALAALLLADRAQAEAIVSGPPAGVAMRQSFADAFDGAALDRTRWRTAFKQAGRGPESLPDRSLYANRERQLYVEPGLLDADLDPFALGGGVLTISAAPMSAAFRARVEEAVARLPAPIAGSALKDVAYTSGMISSRGAFAQTYGYFEIRARWRGGQGIWPAFWLLPADGSWPPEIDVIEALGREPGRTYHSVHSGRSKSVTVAAERTGDEAVFHTYGLLWTKATLRYFVDGRQVASIPTPRDARKPMYLIANLAIGGHWPGDPDATTLWPATMEIDFIRAWRFSDGAK